MSQIGKPASKQADGQYRDGGAVEGDTGDGRVIATLVKALSAAHPGVSATAGLHSALFRSVNGSGFDVAIEHDGGRWSIALGGLVAEMDDLGQAIAVANDALSGNLRLRLDFVGSRLAAVATEREDLHGIWREELASGLPVLGAWRMRRSVYRRYEPSGAGMSEQTTMVAQLMAVVAAGRSGRLSRTRSAVR